MSVVTGGASRGSVIEFIGVNKRFGPVIGVADLDLRIEGGEFVSLLGPSGSGKSTTLNLLAGLLSADSGDILINSRRVNDLSPDRRDIAMVFQNYALYPHMTVFENLAFPLEAPRRKISAQDIERRVRDVAKTVGIDALLARYPKEISGGQQQRVALGRAMIRDPDVFLLDEPLSNLDARLRLKMRHDLKALHERLAATIVYVTHDQAEAMSLSDRVAVFSGGRLQQYAPPADIYNLPANAFVANFVGEREMNMVEGVLSRTDGAVRFQGGINLEFPAGRDLGDIEGQTVKLGFRPEAITVAQAATGAAFSGVVTLTEISGPDVTFYITADGAEICCRCQFADAPKKGDRIALRLPWEQTYAFDAKTGKALMQRGKPNVASDS